MAPGWAEVNFIVEIFRRKAIVFPEIAAAQYD